MPLLVRSSQGAKGQPSRNAPGREESRPPQLGRVLATATEVSLALDMGPTWLSAPAEVGAGAGLLSQGGRWRRSQAPPAICVAQGHPSAEADVGGSSKLPQRAGSYPSAEVGAGGGSKVSLLARSHPSASWVVPLS